ncbi:hypothetical protein DCAR_0415796 [Daucus carota subsp. sativus]|uniref:Cytochrome P450 n=1 Tax=Daucus carota subsp. sativus TaxID=79200 RepID=A0AAF0WWZ1_DAUCS|nr:PREDICTED: cytochrome P450 76A2-like [Daucus carota subsp. sativus]WOG96461.1 hypothetical protein DCAR_0415796 [Daucus carota subsp. sativus]
MEGNHLFTWLTAALLASFPTILVLRWLYGRIGLPNRKPPGPPAWPLVGNIFDLGTMPHQDFYKLRPKYGPVLWLKLGLVDTMVIQSAKAAAELFKNHDAAFSDRQVPDALTACKYNQGSLAMGTYGPYWRTIRKLCSTEFLVTKRINDSTEIREKCVEKLVCWIEQNIASSQVEGRSGQVELAQLLFLMSFNLVGNLMLSKDLLDLSSNQGREFFNAMNQVMKWAGTPNLADFLPFLKPFDPFKVRKNMAKDMGVAMNIISSFLKDRGHESLSTEKVKKDFLDVLLEYQGDGKEGPDKISERNILIIILEMFFAGSETTSSSIEWAMAELLRNPESMRKVKTELESVIMPNKRVMESDMDKLPYLQAVVKETLRLHPTIPLLMRRNSKEDTKFMGYHVPKNTQVFVNVWAIGRDPDAWEDPLSFKPERFIGSNINYNGQHYELLPFGSGRRICVGMALAHRVLHLTLATLLWTFDWELDRSVTPGSLDMAERMGITLRKLEPLKAIPRKRILVKDEMII